MHCVVFRALNWRQFHPASFSYMPTAKICLLPLPAFYSLAGTTNCCQHVKIKLHAKSSMIAHPTVRRGNRSRTGHARSTIDRPPPPVLSFAEELLHYIIPIICGGTSSGSGDCCRAGTGAAPTYAICQSDLSSPSPMFLRENCVLYNPYHLRRNFYNMHIDSSSPDCRAGIGAAPDTRDRRATCPLSQPLHPRPNCRA